MPFWKPVRITPHSMAASRAAGARAAGDTSDARGLLFNSDTAVWTPLFWEERPIQCVPQEQIESG